MKKELIFLDALKGESLANLVDYWSLQNNASSLATVTDNPRIKSAIDTILEELQAPNNGLSNNLGSSEALGVSLRRIYLNVKDGKIYKGAEAYDFIEGYLRGIELRDRTFRGETVKYWYTDIEAKSGQLYTLALSYNNGLAKSLFNALASASSFTQKIKIEPYLKGEYQKVKVSQSGEALLWKSPELPPIEEIQLGGKTIKDESKRMEFIEALVNEINDKLKNQ